MAAVSLVLEVRRGNDVREYPLTKQSMIIGRQPENDVVLIDPYVSGRHAKLEWQQGNLYLVDVGSKNGTALNNRKIDRDIPHEYKEGDVISIGDFSLVLRTRQQVSNSPTAPVKATKPTAPPPVVPVQSVWVRVAIIVLVIGALGVLSWFVVPLMFSAGQQSALTDTPQAATQSTTATQPALVTYVNTKDGYSIGYPEGWSINASYETTGAIIIDEPQPVSAELTINVNKMALRENVDKWTQLLRTTSPNVVILTNEQGKGAWDWYLAWDNPKATDANVILHNEAYFKSGDGCSYMVWTVAPIAQYESYPFKDMMNSFQLASN